MLQEVQRTKRRTCIDPTSLVARKSFRTSRSHGSLQRHTSCISSQAQVRMSSHWLHRSAHFRQHVATESAAVVQRWTGRCPSRVARPFDVAFSSMKSKIATGQSIRAQCCMRMPVLSTRSVKGITCFALQSANCYISRLSMA